MPTQRQYQTDADRQKAYRQRQKQARLAELAAKNLPPTPAIPTMPGTARWTALQAQAQAALQAMLDEMRSYYDDRSEQWQETDRAATMQERMDSIESIISDLEGISL
jgi:hypothetical protein